jgi:hypothetical protein
MWSFWHQNDDFTLTSKNYIWTYPGQPYTASSVIVMPEFWVKANLAIYLFTIVMEFVQTILRGY